VLTEEKLNKINATLEYLGNPFATLHKRSEFHTQKHQLPQATTNCHRPPTTATNCHRPPPTNPAQTTAATLNLYVQKQQDLIRMS
jgi:hypothetical protein